MLPLKQTLKTGAQTMEELFKKLLGERSMLKGNGQIFLLAFNKGSSRLF